MKRFKPKPKELRTMVYFSAVAAVGLVLGLTTCGLHQTGRPAHAPDPYAQVRGQDPVVGESVRLSQASRLHLAGGATIGKWDCTSETVHGRMAPGLDLMQADALFDQLFTDLRSEATVDAGELELSLRHAPEADLRVYVTSLACGNAAMERDMHAALRADEFTRIEYVLEAVHHVAGLGRDERGRPVVTLPTRGTLTLAGQTRPIEMNVDVTRLDQHRYRVVGRKDLRMTDFGVEPPTALFGLIRAHDTVQAVFDLILEPPTHEIR